MGSKQTSFGFGKAAKGEKTKRYYPNVAAFIGLGFFYKTVGISFSYLLQKQRKEQETNLGKTNFFDLELRSYQIKFGFTGHYQNYKGFYVAKPGTLASGAAEPLPQRADLRLQNIGGQFFGIANWRRFSMQAAFQNTKRQVKSGGSFLYMLNAQYLTIGGDSAVNTNLATNLMESGPIEKVGFLRGRFVSLSPLAGYGHTFVAFKSFYITGAYFLGPGLQYQYITKEDGSSRHYYSPYMASSLKAATGYNGKRFFASFQVLADANRNVFRGVRLQANSSSTMLQVGYRF
jgi:hypothetical protein